MVQYMQLLEHNLPTIRQWLDSFGYEFVTDDAGRTLSVNTGGSTFENVAPGKFVCIRPEERSIWVADEAPPIEENPVEVQVKPEFDK